MLITAVLLLVDVSISQEIEKMGHKNFHVRDVAFRKLSNMGEMPIRLLKIARDTNKDLDVSEKSRHLIDRFYASIKPTHYLFTPWIDGLPNDYPNRDQIIKKYIGYGSACGDYTNGWSNYRVATQKFISELYDNGTPIPSIVELLNKMVEAEKIWCKQNSYCPMSLKYQCEMQED